MELSRAVVASGAVEFELVLLRRVEQQPAERA
jgi:hypothetical protein